jgi:hypothetical protein
MIESLRLHEPLCVKPSTDLMNLLTLFQEGHAHMAAVSLNPVATIDCMRQGIRTTEKEAIIGIVTMEDVLEKIIQHDIHDETDAKKGVSTGVSNTYHASILYHNPTNKSRVYSRMPKSPGAKSILSDSIASTSPGKDRLFLLLLSVHLHVLALSSFDAFLRITLSRWKCKES